MLVHTYSLSVITEIMHTLDAEITNLLIVIVRSLFLFLEVNSPAMRR